MRRCVACFSPFVFLLLCLDLDRFLFVSDPPPAMQIGPEAARPYFDQHAPAHNGLRWVQKMS
jgi:hypothetical protein